MPDRDRDDARKDTYPEELYGDIGRVEGEVGPTEPVNIPGAGEQEPGWRVVPPPDDRPTDEETEATRERTRDDTMI